MSAGYRDDDDEAEAPVSRSRILGGPALSGVSLFASAEDDGEGWEGPGAREPRPSLCRTGCVTSDFAMQNVLLAMGLRLVSLDGRVIRRPKRFVLRCGACFHVEYERLERLFCGRCGSDSLFKASLGPDGQVSRSHVERVAARRPRGVKYPIPKHDNLQNQTRFAGKLLLREDQLLAGIWHQKAQRHRAAAKQHTSVFGPDVAESIAALDLAPAGLTVGYGRKNPNAAKGRERRGATKKKKSRPH